MNTRLTNRAVPSSRRPFTAAKVMTPNPKSINRNATVRETAEILHDHGLHTAPVIDDAGRPIGVVSRTDLLDYWGRRRDRVTALAAGEMNAAFAPTHAFMPGDELTVREIMTPVVFGVRRNASLASIVEKMIALEVRCLFVTDEDGVLVGTIRVFDVLRHLARRETDHAARETPNVTFHPSISRLGPVGAMPP
jgi:CBS domain-containing membrane protein